MIYLESFYMPSLEKESRYEYSSAYPFNMYTKRDFTDIHFSNITIFYGENGSGKSTLLNIINEKLNLQRKTPFYKDEHFDKFVSFCKARLAIDEITDDEIKIPKNSKIIASEDIANYIIDIRNQNINTSETKEKLKKEYLDVKFTPYKNSGLSDYDYLKKKSETMSITQSEYIRRRTKFVRQHSNGEWALKYYDVELENDGLYLLDEPENSLSPNFQIELMDLIIECSRFCGCQFIICTHSPFILSIPGAKIYNLDKSPVEVCKWSELDNMKLYYDFFKRHDKDFED